MNIIATSFHAIMLCKSCFVVEVGLPVTSTAQWLVCQASIVHRNENTFFNRGLTGV